MKNKWIKILIVSVLWIGFSSPPAEGESVDTWKLALLPTTLADFGHLTLSDVADKALTSSELLKQYGRTRLERAGSDGVQVSEILMALGRAGVPPSRIHLLSDSTRKVMPSPQTAVVTVVREAIIRKVAELNQFDPASISLEFTQIPGDLPKRENFSKVSVQPLIPLFHIEFLNERDQSVASATFEGKLSLRATVLAAKAPLMTGEYVTAENFSEEVRELSEVGGLVRSASELREGRWQLKQGLESGSILKRQDLQKLSQLQVGSMVTVIKKDPRFQVQTLGRIKEVMDNGASVLVENLDSKKEIVGKPISANEVEVNY